MGSWTLFSPASYGYYAGVLGLAMYAVSSGVPAVLPATIVLLAPSLASMCGLHPCDQ